MIPSSFSVKHLRYLPFGPPSSKMDTFLGWRGHENGLLERGEPSQTSSWRTETTRCPRRNQFSSSSDSWAPECRVSCTAFHLSYQMPFRNALGAPPPNPWEHLVLDFARYGTKYAGLCSAALAPLGTSRHLSTSASLDLLTPTELRLHGSRSRRRDSRAKA
jgi:hypothetical protein